MKINKVIQDKRNFIYKGTINNFTLGVVAFKIDKLFYNADVSFTLHSDHEDKKILYILLKKAILRFYKDYQFNINLIAKIKIKNHISKLFFYKFGFDLILKDKKNIYLKKSAFCRNSIISKKSVGVIIQARQTSQRLPNKVLKTINGSSIIELLLARLVRSKMTNKMIVAIPKNQKNNKLFNNLKIIKADIYRGSEKNVLKRYFDAAKKNKIRMIVRITSDCPLLDYKLLDKIINFAINSDVDYASNTKPATLPKGFSIEVFKYAALKNSLIHAKKNYQKEHVNYYIHENKNFTRSNFYLKNMNFSSKNFSIDSMNDLRFVTSIFKKFLPNIHFSLKDIAKVIKKI